MAPLLPHSPDPVLHQAASLTLARPLVPFPSPAFRPLQSPRGLVSSSPAAGGLPNTHHIPSPTLVTGTVAVLFHGKDKAI